MIKFKQGYIKNTKTGVSRDIVVRAKSANKPKDIFIGGVLIVCGVMHLTAAAFRNGSKAYEKAEYETLDSLGLFVD